MLLLDTNALVALLIYPDRLGKRTKRAIERAGEVFCSSISLAELRIKSLKRKFDIEPVMAKLASAVKQCEEAVIEQSGQAVMKIVGVEKGHHHHF